MATAIEAPLYKALSPEYTSNCKITKVDLDLEAIGEPGKIAYILEKVFSPEECQSLITLTEAEGYSPALIHFGNQAVRATGYRDSQRIMVDDKEFVKILFQRIGHLLPKTVETSGGLTYDLLEINERLRFLRYDPGDKFKPHSDGHYDRPDGSASTKITLQMYLNEGFEGGETTFLKRPFKSLADDINSSENRLPVVPKTGMVLVFQHDILHEGSLLKSGQKYSVRTDVLYSNNYAHSKSNCSII